MVFNETQKIYNILKEHEKRIKELERIVSRLMGKEERETEEAKIVANFQKFSRKTGIDIPVLKRLFDVEEREITLLKIIGDSTKEKVQNITLVILLAYKHLFDMEEVLAHEIRRNVAELGVSLNNFSRHLNEIKPRFIRRKGKPKSPRTVYKLTMEGEIKAREILRNLSEIYGGEAK